MGYVGLEEDYYVSVKSVLDITAETGALTTQSRIRELTPADVVPTESQKIGYDQCANAMLKMWMDNVVTDGEYNRIMDRLNKLYFSGGEREE